MKIFLIIGLPGSGKTHLANHMLQNGDGNLLLDDIPSLKTLPNYNEGVKLVITDPRCCDPQIEMQAKKLLKERYPLAEIDCIYFENDLEKCLNNVEYRNDGRLVRKSIEMWSKIYNPPESALKIWQNE